MFLRRGMMVVNRSSSGSSLGATSSSSSVLATSRMLLMRTNNFLLWGGAGGEVPIDPRLGGVRTATKKAGGTTKNSPGSPGKRMGLKKSGGQFVEVGHVLVRQRGRKYWEGINVGCGRDYTLFALKAGILTFTKVRRINGDTVKTVANVIERVPGDNVVKGVKSKPIEEAGKVTSNTKMVDGLVASGKDI